MLVIPKTPWCKNCLKLPIYSARTALLMKNYPEIPQCSLLEYGPNDTYSTTSSWAQSHFIVIKDGILTDLEKILYNI